MAGAGTHTHTQTQTLADLRCDAMRCAQEVSSCRNRANPPSQRGVRRLFPAPCWNHPKLPAQHQGDPAALLMLLCPVGQCRHFFSTATQTGAAVWRVGCGAGCVNV
uniref:Uncharacterized protein n=1 Tax=Physcomitrium patens TaxID=3218 RepID=A0A2K1K369_PHYPA|nr:hypothetical protein PHYPA_012694 [Physcomitrium patens]